MEPKPESDIKDLILGVAIADNDDDDDDDDVDHHSWSFLSRQLNTDASISDPPPNIPPFLLSPPNIIQTLTLKPYRYSLSDETRTLTLIASSLSCLIFLAADHALIANPFSGVEVPSPIFPLPLRQPLLGILTSSPLTDDSCTLIITAKFCTLFWRLAGERSWIRENGLRLGREVGAFTMLNGLLYCLGGTDYSVKVVNFEDPAGISWRNLNLQTLRPPPDCKGITRRILERNGEILLVLFFSPRLGKYGLDVYEVDLARKMWVKKESLGDWCLFLDFASNSPLACLKPFGVRNCVYVAGPGCNRWCVLHYGLEYYANAENGVLDILCKVVKAEEVWPSPIWIKYGLNEVIQIDH